MRKKKKTLDFIIVLTVFLVFILITFFSKQDGTSMLLNIIVLVIMLAFLLAGLGRLGLRKGLGQLAAFTEDLDRLSVNMEALAKESAADVAFRFRENDECRPETEYVSNALDNFYSDLDKLYRDDELYYECDIADYINEDTVNVVGNLAFNDFVSNAMTGMGILGTFIGLAFGLRSFDTATAETMTNSIAPLIEGIKVAFYTSIFGVCFSIVYGTLMRNRFNKANQAVARFTTLFYRYIGNHPENAAMANLLQNEREQTNAMNQFAEDISLALVDTMKPLMESLQEELRKTGEQMTRTVTETQANGIGNIVDKFFVQMDSIMGNQFTHLGETLKGLCEWQGKMVDGLEGTVGNIINQADTLSAINTSFAATLLHFQSFAEQIDSFHKESAEEIRTIVSEIRSTAEFVGDLSAEMAEINRRDGEILENVKDISTTIRDQESELENIVKTQIQMIEVSCQQLLAQTESIRTSANGILDAVEAKGTEMAETFEKTCADMLRSINVASVEMASGLSSAAAEMTYGLNNATAQMVSASERLANGMDGAMERTYQLFDSQLARAMEHFGGTLHELQTVVESTPKLVDSAGEKLTKETIGYIAAVKKNHAELSEMMVQYAASITECARHLDESMHNLQIQLVERGSER